MVQVARQGREAMKDLIEQKKRDAIYTEADADTVREYNAAMKQLSIGTARIANVFFRTIVPAFSAITRAVGDFVKYLSQHETAVKAFFIMLTGLIMGLLLPSILTFFSTLLTNPITWIILLLGLLAIAIDDLVGWAN
jgi:purine-cytosine permease-like protein